MKKNHSTWDKKFSIKMVMIVLMLLALFMFIIVAV